MEKMTVEELLAEMNNKLQALTLIESSTSRILSRGKLREVQKQLNIFEVRIEDLKLLTMDQHLKEKTATDEIQSWSVGIDEQLEKFDVIIDELQRAVTDITSKNTAEEERHRFDQREHEEKKIEEMKIQMRLDMEREVQRNTERRNGLVPTANVKLPKMEITKFQGTHLDWQRFWNQFEAEIDKSSISQISKFSYLKEMVVQKVRLTIDGLPFTVEGYERAKSILKSRYGKER